MSGFWKIFWGAVKRLRLLLVAKSDDTKSMNLFVRNLYPRVHMIQQSRCFDYEHCSFNRFEVDVLLL